MIAPPFYNAVAVNFLFQGQYRSMELLRLDILGIRAIALGCADGAAKPLIKLVVDALAVSVNRVLKLVFAFARHDGNHLSFPFVFIPGSSWGAGRDLMLICSEWSIPVVAGVLIAQRPNSNLVGSARP
jgi:hypothetical protein